MSVYRESARDVPVAASADVVVAGGGPAGVCAALAAARSGARTVLLESAGCLGGAWTTSLVAWVIDSGNKGGVLRRIIDELDRRGVRAPRQPGAPNFAFDVETMKLILEEMCSAEGVTVQLNTRVCAGGVRDGRLTTAVSESKSGRQAWNAEVFIDATGDGDLAALVGCSYDLGHPESGMAQPLSMAAVVGGVRLAEIEQFVGGGMRESKERLLAELERAGVSPSYRPPIMFHIGGDMFVMIPTHHYGVACDDAAALTAATIEGRAEVARLVAALRCLGGVWKDLRVIASAEHIGIREGRRVHGLYTVSADDVLNGTGQNDAICRVTSGFDVHSVDPARSRGFDHPRCRGRAYDVPLRSLIARDVKGLMLAGRCISGDFWSHSSYRVTGNAAAMGEAAGVTAAMAATSGRLPRDVPFAEVTEGLRQLEHSS